MLHVYVDKSVGKIVIETDDPSAGYLLESVKRETKYIPWEKWWDLYIQARSRFCSICS